MLLYLWFSTAFHQEGITVSNTRSGSGIVRYGALIPVVAEVLKDRIA